MNFTEITVYGAYWCPDCRRSKKFLGEQRVPYRWVDIEQDPEGEKLVMQMNAGKRIIPTIVFGDGSILVEPTNAALARKLGLKNEPLQTYYDLIVIGSGPTGLTAAIYAAREGIETLVVERSSLGGQAGMTQGIENFPGFPDGISGEKLASRIVKQARRFGVEILQAEDIIQLGLHDGYQCAINAEGIHFHARAVLIATGASYRRLEVPGEDDFIGAGIHFCATCDGPFYKGAQEVVVVGGGNSACEESLHLARFAQKVVLLVRGDRLKASRILVDKITRPDSGIEVHYHTHVEAFEGQNGRLSGVRACNEKSGQSITLKPAAVFIFIGQQPNSGFARNHVRTDDFGYILTGHDLLHGKDWQESWIPRAFETSRTGVFAAGDVRQGSTNQVAAAVGEGAAAAISIRDFLKQEG